VATSGEAYLARAIQATHAAGQQASTSPAQCANSAPRSGAGRTAILATMRPAGATEQRVQKPKAWMATRRKQTIAPPLPWHRGVVNIGVRDYDYFINSKAKLYPRQVRVGVTVGKEFKEESFVFDVWEWHKGAGGQQLVNFNTFHVGDGDQHTASKFVTIFRALSRR